MRRLFGNLSVNTRNNLVAGFFSPTRSQIRDGKDKIPKPQILSEAEENAFKVPPHFSENRVMLTETGLSLTQLSWNESDHKVCMITIHRVGKWIIANMLMEGAVKIVNGEVRYVGGHQAHETKEAYQKRYRAQARELAKLLNANPDIIRVDLQEAVLEKDYKRAFI